MTPAAVMDLQGTALEAEALGQFEDEVRKAGLILGEAERALLWRFWMAAWVRSGRWTIEAMSVLSTPDVRRAFLVLGDLYATAEHDTLEVSR